MRLRKVLASASAVFLGIVWSIGITPVHAANAPAQCGTPYQTSWNEPNTIHGKSFWADKHNGHIGIAYEEWAAYDNHNNTCTIQALYDVDVANVSWHGWIGPQLYINAGPVSNGDYNTYAAYGGMPWVSGGQSWSYYTNPTDANNHPCAHVGSILNGGWGNGPYYCNPYYGTLPGGRDHCAAAPADQYGNPLPAAQQTALCGYIVEFTIPYNTGWCIGTSNSLVQEDGSPDVMNLTGGSTC